MYFLNYSANPYNKSTRTLYYRSRIPKLIQVQWILVYCQQIPYIDVNINVFRNLCTFKTAIRLRIL